MFLRFGGGHAIFSENAAGGRMLGVFNGVNGEWEFKFCWEDPDENDEVESMPLRLVPESKITIGARTRFISDCYRMWRELNAVVRIHL